MPVNTIDPAPLPLNTTSGTASGELERVCKENALVIETWSPIHLRAKLKELYWKPEKPAVGAFAFAQAVGDVRSLI